MKSEFDAKKIKPKDKNKLYELAFSYVLNETQVLWQLSQVFLLGNTVLSGFVVTILTKPKQDIANDITIYFLSGMGIIVSFLWLFSYARTSKYYEFRIAQAKQREPEHWMLFNGDGENFSEGATIEIDCKKYNFGIWRFGSLLLVKILAWMFIAFYLLIIIFLSKGYLR